MLRNLDNTFFNFGLLSIAVPFHTRVKNRLTGKLQQIKLSEIEMLYWHTFYNANHNSSACVGVVDTIASVDYNNTGVATLYGNNNKTTMEGVKRRRGVAGGVGRLLAG